MTLKDSFENIGWGLRSLFSGGETIIGPNEPLPPTDIAFRDLRDYSGTATLNEVSDVLKAQGSQFHDYKVLKNQNQYASKPAFHLGKFLDISGGRVKPTHELWLQETSLYKNVAIIGPPGSGKTEGLIIPGIKAAIDAGLSNIVIDVKGGSFINKLGDYARQKGFNVIYWSTHPQEVGRSHSINLLDNIFSIQDAQILAKSLYGNVESLGDNRQYAMRDIGWMAQWIRLVKHIFGNRATLNNIYQIAENPAAILTQLLPLCQDSRLQSAIQSQLRLIQNSDSGEGAFTWAIQDAIGFFGWPNFQQVTGHSDILLRDIQHHPTLFIIGAELAGRDVSKKISSAMIDILMTIFYERWTQNQEGQGIVFWIDEFPRIQEQINITEFTSVARSARGSIVIAAQSLEQIIPDYREQVMENFDTVVLCRGVGFGAAEWLSSRLGTRQQNLRKRRNHRTHSESFLSGIQIPLTLHFIVFFTFIIKIYIKFLYLICKILIELITLVYGVILRFVQSSGTYYDNARYEVWRESMPVLDSREIQYPVGNQYVAIVHSRTACRKPFLVDYKREISPNTTWQDRSQSHRLSSDECRSSSSSRASSQSGAILGSGSSQLSWREPNSNQGHTEQAGRFNWHEPDSTPRQNEQQNTGHRLNWRDDD
ncbi:type IV secretory system conjugative DNA transfer family protein [Geitlerinema sp. P-1104]|uniref:type IV secretory system conjugative DNA transfer family protein n=1 Tax=Geitlerinema sp. P-1104 TaxID=2546230 RepID=UPI0025703215|nr:type IV secretory system conjugative DNA transfer family protein [Geitlerinema sp. P-1104]